MLGDLEAAYTEIKPYGYARDYYLEITSKIELFAIAAQLNSLIVAFDKEGDKGYQQRLPQAKKALEALYEEYSPVVDKQLFETLLEMYVKDQETNYISPLLKEWLTASGNSFPTLAKRIFDEKAGDGNEIKMLLNKPASEVVSALKNLQSTKLYNDLLKTYQLQVQLKLNDTQARINKLNRSYMQAQIEVFKEKTFYPDANSTLRVTYGNVKGYNPRDAVKYDFYTYLDGVMDKYKPGDYEFDVPEKIRTLYKNKDYGQYGSKGKMPVCFIAMNHTTGGNSGSPALDAYGNLVGLNFDRVWEGTMSDINYDPSICRNIMVDIRYVLFIIDKYAGATHLVQEMKLVHPKKK